MIELLRTQLQKARRLADRGVAALELVHGSKILGQLSPMGLATFARKARHMKFGPHLALVLHAINSPDKEALVCGTQRLSYRDFDGQVNRLSHALMELGFAPKDPVAVMLPNCVEHMVAQECLPRIGAVAVQVGYRLKGHEIAHILDNSHPEFLIYHYLYEAEVRAAIDESETLDERQLIVVGAPEGAETYGHDYDELLATQSDELPAHSGSGEGGVIIYTSGTTGKPKGASRNWSDTGIESVSVMMHRTGMRSDDRHLVVCPLYHSGALAFVKMQVSLGATLVLMEHFDAEGVLQLIQNERISSAFMVPTMLVRINALPEDVRKRYDTSSLRWIMSGAAPLSTDTARAFQNNFGKILHNFYGSTETGTVSYAGPEDHASHPGTVGQILQGNEVRILNEEGEEAEPGEVGELYVRNEMLIGGYHRNAGATQKSLVDGFFSVGDLARLDEDGYLYLASRKHDMVISGGVNIYPREIEEHLHHHPDILEAAVVGVPDEEWGESLRAYVVTKPGHPMSEAEVVQHCREGLASYKQPRSVVFLDALPRNPTGKVLKKELRKR